MTSQWFDRAEKVIVDCFQSVRPQLMAAFGNVDSSLKADDTVVTDLDKSVEVKIRQVLTDFDPSIGLVGEEQGGQASAGAFWLIDPIDGTENFVRGLIGTRNMVTLIEDGQVTFTVVYRFMTDELYTARRDGGAFRNGERLEVSKRLIGRSFIELSCPLGSPTNTNLVNAVRQQTAGYRVSGDWLATVEGKIDVMLVYDSGGGDWDYAPRALLMQEAGAKVGNIGAGQDGSTYDYRNHNLLAASPAVFDVLMPVIKAATS